MQENADPSAENASETLTLRKALAGANRAAQAAVRDTTRLTRLFTILSEPLPLELMLDQALSTLSELFAADIVILLDPGGTGAFTPLAAVGLPEDMLRLPMSDGCDGDAATVMATNRPILNAVAGADPHVESQFRELGAQVALWIPVNDSHAARGALVLARCRKDDFERADIDLLTAMAYRIGLALEQAQRSAQLVRIAQTGKEIGRHLDEREVCREAVRMLPTVLWVDAAALVSINPDGAHQCAAQIGLDPAWDDLWGRLGARLLDKTLSTGGLSFATEDVTATEEWRSLEFQDRCPVRAFLAVPVLREERIRGLLFAMRFSALPFTPDTTQMTLLYAGQISAALENARLYDEIKQMHAERLSVEQHKQQAWRTESLSRMAGGIAHHFNNQLFAVMGNLELALLDLPQGTRTRSKLVDALRASNRAAEISRLMLAYLGQTMVEKRFLDPADIVQEALPLLSSALPGNVHLKVDCTPMGPVIFGDGVYIKQVLTNLVSNAVEALGEKEGQIALAVGPMTSDNVRASRCFPPNWTPRGDSWAAISVSDAGCGLREENREQIFDPFFSTKMTGRGLGLSVALGMMRTHEGAIAVESEPGRGSTFRLIFPAVTPEVQPSITEEDGSIPEQPRGNVLVLVVDDEPANRTLAAAQLAELGYTTIQACDGVEALEIFRAKKDEIRLVLLDLSMARKGGWETLSAMRAMRSDIPVVLASGYNEAQVMDGEHPELPQGFLHKPFGLSDLKATIGSVPKPSTR